MSLNSLAKVQIVFKPRLLILESDSVQLTCLFELAETWEKRGKANGYPYALLLLMYS